MTPGRRAILLMVLFSALWAVIEAVAARVLSGAYSAYQVVFSRYVVHIAILLVVWGWREPAPLWRTRRPGYQLARSFLMLVMPASWIMAVGRGVESSSVMAIFWLSPLLVVALGRAVLGERASPALWAGAALASAGAVAVFIRAPLPAARFLVLPVAMAVSFSLYVVMTRSLRSEPTRANLLYTALGVALALAPFMPRLWVTPSLRDGLVMAAVGALGLAALWALDRATAAAPVAVSAPFASLQVACTLGLDWGLHLERPGLRAAAALSLILAVALLQWLREPGLAFG